MFNCNEVPRTAMTLTDKLTDWQLILDNNNKDETYTGRL